MPLDSLNVARMMQKFIGKKKSVGYTHPPILTDEKHAEFKCYDHEGNVLLVTVRPYSLEDELLALNPTID